LPPRPNQRIFTSIFFASFPAARISTRQDPEGIAPPEPIPVSMTGRLLLATLPTTFP